MAKLKLKLVQKLPSNHPAEMITIYPYVFTKHDVLKMFKDNPYNKTLINMLRHECIHLQQQKEMLVIFAYILYFIEWVVKSMLLFSFDKGRYAVSFEQEAYRNQADSLYLEDRKHFAFFKYIFSLNIDYIFE